MGTKIEFHWNKDTGKIVKETVFAGDENKTLLFMANEARKLMIPYVPMVAGVLFKSVNVYVEKGQGIVHHIVPYARYQYYGKVMVSGERGNAKKPTNKDLKYSTFKHPLATSFWDKAMKTARGAELSKAVQNFIKQKGG